MAGQDTYQGRQSSNTRCLRKAMLSRDDDVVGGLVSEENEDLLWQSVE